MKQTAEETLLESALLAWRVAPELCRKDPTTGVDCSWYHSLWQILRLMGLAGTAEHRADFYQRAARTLTADTSNPRILVCGTADYAMLAHLINTFRDAPVRPSLTVIDICETPLHLNRWYAERLGWRLATTRSDILDFATAEPFHLICTDSILGRFAPELRPRLADKWRSLLEPGGRVVTASVVRPGNSPRRLAFAEDQITRFQEAVRHLAGEKGILTGVDLVELGDRAGHYARRQSNYPLRSRQEFLSIFEDAGFSIDEISESSRPTDNHSGVKAPTVPSGAVFHQIVARRR